MEKRVSLSDAQNNPENLFHSDPSTSEFEFKNSDLLSQHGELVAKYRKKFKKLCEEYNVSTNSDSLASLCFYLNIIDPINPSNNLGKSVSYFNSKRIKRILEKQKATVTELELMKEAIKANGYPFNDVIQYKHQLTSFLAKTFSSLDITRLQDFQCAQVKLTSPQLPYEMYNFPAQMPYPPVHFQPAPDAYVSASTSVKDPNTLFNFEGDALPLEQLQEGIEGPKTMKVRERKSSWTSTCKSTVNSHKENVPSSTAQEEIKVEESDFDCRENKSLSLAPNRGKKSAKEDPLGIAVKHREPLTSRKLKSCNRGYFSPDSEKQKVDPRANNGMSRTMKILFPTLN
jgi:hypothetical protein